jgi:hypothetical protein
MEHWECLNCGSTMDVHCNYLPEVSRAQCHERFRGVINLTEDAIPLKTFLRLKNALSFAERFRSASLEAQYLTGSREWDLGEFLDFEVEQARVVCERIGLQASFKRMPL